MQVYNTGRLCDMVTVRSKGAIRILIPLRRFGSSIFRVVQLILVNRLTGSCRLDYSSSSAGLGLSGSSYTSNCSSCCLGPGGGGRDDNGMGSGCKVRSRRGCECRSSSGRGSLCPGRSRGTGRSLSTVRLGYEYVDNRNNHQEQGQQSQQGNYRATRAFPSRSC